MAGGSASHANYNVQSWQKLGESFNNNYALDFPWREQVVRRLLSYDKAIDSMLDVACCTGWYIEKLRNRGFRANYCGVDITPNFVMRAQLANPNERFEIGDIRHLRWADKEFDLVFAGGVLMHLAPQDLSLAMNELFRVARQSVFIYTYGDQTRDRIEYDFKRQFFNIYYTLDTLKLRVPEDWVMRENYFFQDNRHFVEFTRRT